MRSDQLHRLGALGALLLGLIAYFQWTHGLVLDPNNLAWLQMSNGDPVMHTLGWWHFRDTPWGIPPGISPRNGIELSSSVAFSDSLPLFALPFKLLQAVLPPIPQYWGIWLLLCSMLQAVFAYLLARALRGTILVALVTAYMMALAPPYLFRAGAHLALSGHWLVLAALWLYARPNLGRVWYWPLLLAVAAAVHAYLLAMVLAIWVASLVQRVWMGDPKRGLVGEFVLGVAATGLVLWTVGFLMLGRIDTWGLGTFRFNLAGFVDPNGWSLFLPDIPDVYGEYEGFAYLGLGLLLLLIPAILTFRAPFSAMLTPRWTPLVVALLGLALFAVSPAVAIGPYHLFVVPLPAWLESALETFRSSGRMIWPSYYFLAVALLVLVARRFGPRRGAVIVVVALLIQLVDTYPGWRSYMGDQVAPAPTLTTDLTSPFWDAAATAYPKIREIPVQEIGRHWMDLSSLAARHRIATDSIYLGRVDQKAWADARAAAERAVRTGSFELDALYVLAPGSARWASRQVQPGDLFGTIDGLVVFARGGAHLLADSGTMATPVAVAAPVLAPQHRVTFSYSAEGTPYLADGWSDPAKKDAYADHQRAQLQFSAPGLPDGAVLRLQVHGQTRSADVPQTVRVLVNGHDAGMLVIPNGRVITVDLPLFAHPDGNFLLDFEIAEASGPFIANPGGLAGRPVGLWLDAMELVPPGS